MSAPEAKLGLPLVEVAPHPELVASVIIPAKNEEELLPHALIALASQRGVASHTFEVIVLVNNSTDATTAVARRFAYEHSGLALHVVSRDLPPPDANIGSVRRLLMDEACRRLSACPPGLKIILSTDADSAVAPDWIAQNIREIRQGAAAVGGAIHFNPDEREALPRRVRLMQRKDDQYKQLTAWLEDRLDPQPHDRWPRHQHHFGASLALKVDAYRKIGGVPPKEFLEDVALYEALLRHDLPFRHSPHVQVFTSARMKGRASVGLSEQLTVWDNAGHAGTEAKVDSVEYLVRLFEARHELRRIWEAQRSSRCSEFDYTLDRFCRQNRLSRRKLLDALDSPFFGEAWHRLDFGADIRRLLAGRDFQPLADAVAELQSLQSPSRDRASVIAAQRKGRVDTIPA